MCGDFNVKAKGVHRDHGVARACGRVRNPLKPENSLIWLGDTSLKPENSLIWLGDPSLKPENSLIWLGDPFSNQKSDLSGLGSGVVQTRKITYLAWGQELLKPEKSLIWLGDTSLKPEK